MRKQVSFLDYPQLIGTAKFGVMVTPSQLAERLKERVGGVPEVSFDELGPYEFYGLETDDGLLGFRKHQGVEKSYSYVSFIPKSEIDARVVISQTTGLQPSEILVFQDQW